MANSSISLVSLDFDDLKNSLKTFLQSQSQFTDYNFDGSSISVLLDLLSYNSYLNAFYLNMVMSESFLDSAQLRGSVVSRAKELNYTPRSYKSSKATVSLQLNQGGLTSLTIPSGIQFNGKNANAAYTFTTNNSVVVYPSGGYFTANLDIYEGTYVNDVYVVDNTIQNQRFILSNQNVDTDTIIVLATENSGQTITTFTQALSLYGLNSTSNVYFLQAVNDSSYELVFGDGVFGRAPLNGAIIGATYRVSNGTDADGSTNFNLTDILPVSGTVTTISASSGSANAESIDSIRYNAPRQYQTQERAITTADFKSLVLSNYTNVKACHVFGGETVSGSIDYGKVYISPLSYSGSTLSLSEKADIVNFLLQRCTVGITPTIVDPDFLYLQVNTTVKYDPNSTVLASSDINQTVADAINSYNSTYLEDFDTTFSFSRFEQAINNSDPSIFSNQTTVTLKKIASPMLNTPVYISINYRNSINPATVSSSKFLSIGREYYFTDYNPNNNTFTIQQSVNGSTVINSTNTIYLVDITNPQYPVYTNYGTVDYITGAISVNQITISDFYNSPGIIFYATPVNQDVTSSQNDVIEIDIAEGTTITVTSI